MFFLDLSTLSSFKFCHVCRKFVETFGPQVILSSWSVKQVVSLAAIKYMQGIRPLATGEGYLNGDWAMQLLVQPQEVATRVQSKTGDLWWGKKERKGPEKMLWQVQCVVLKRPWPRLWTSAFSLSAGYSGEKCQLHAWNANAEDWRWKRTLYWQYIIYSFH